jgi:hypothetical protein
MPMDAAAVRGRAALSGLGLFLTAIIMAYLNSKTSTFFWSTTYVVAIVVAGLGSASSFSTALGITHGLARAAAYVTAWVPWFALYFVGIQALHYKSDGIDGFFAGLAVLNLVFLVAFGVTDSIGVVFGNAFQKIADAADEAQARMDAANSALHGKR